MKISWSKCPACKTTNSFKVEGGAGTTQDFGEPKAYPCKGCDKLLSNGLREWQQITLKKKTIAILRTVYTILFVGIGSGGIISGILMYALGLQEKESELIRLSIIIVSITLVISSFVYIKSLRCEIDASKKRLTKRKT